MPKPLWTGTDPDGWQLIVSLTPADVGVVPQHAVPITGGWAMTQGRDNATGDNATDDLILSRFGPDGGRALETRTVARGGHGDRAYTDNGRLVTKIKGGWSEVKFGSPWGYVPTRTPPRSPLRGLPLLQGEAPLGGGQFLRLYGGSIKTDPAYHAGETAWLQVLDGTRQVKKINLDNVARDTAGNPIGGRYEPEGVTVATLDGEPWVLVGFAVGQLGHTTLNVYGRPLRLVV